MGVCIDTVKESDWVSRLEWEPVGVFCSVIDPCVGLLSGVCVQVLPENEPLAEVESTILRERMFSVGLDEGRSLWECVRECVAVTGKERDADGEECVRCVSEEVSEGTLRVEVFGTVNVCDEDAVIDRDEEELQVTVCGGVCVRSPLVNVLDVVRSSESLPVVEQLWLSLTLPVVRVSEMVGRDLEGVLVTGSVKEFTPVEDAVIDVEGATEFVCCSVLDSVPLCCLLVLLVRSSVEERVRADEYDPDVESTLEIDWDK